MQNAGGTDRNSGASLALGPPSFCHTEHKFIRPCQNIWQLNNQTLCKTVNMKWVEKKGIPQQREALMGRI